MNVVWLPNALEDRIAIFDYIERSSPQNAVLVDESLLRAATHLGELPGSGRASRREGIREWLVRDTGFLLIYRVRDSVVEIVGVVRTARHLSRRTPKL